MIKVKYSIIAAVSDNMVIGNDQKIPWNISEDFKLLKEKTIDNIVIMGKNTWNSLPIKPLPNRINIVVSKELTSEDCNVFKSISEAFMFAKSYIDKEIFIIGGSSIYEQTIKDAQYLYISYVKGNFDGDIFFPKFNKKDYNIIEQKDYSKFNFVKYSKKF